MGNVISEIFPGKLNWSSDRIPDLSGQVTIVTGGNTGIGKETCKVLLNHGARVYLAARNRSKAEEAIEWLKRETGGKLANFLQLDLANLDSVRKAAAEFKEKEQELHILFNSGGVMMPPLDMKTSNGYDLQFGTNVIGHYLFTSLLLPILIHTAKTSKVAGGHVRVINTSSGGHRFAPKGGVDYASIEPNSIAADEARRKIGTHQLYGQSKWGNIVFSNELNRRYRDQGIISIAVHPGPIKTELQRHIPVNIVTRTAEYILDYILLWPPAAGALTQLYAGATPEGLELGGKYLIPWGRAVEPRADTNDELAGQNLWTWLEEQVKAH